LLSHPRNTSFAMVASTTLHDTPREACMTASIGAGVRTRVDAFRHHPDQYWFSIRD
jgi:hypothetical protein